MRSNEIIDKMLTALGWPDLLQRLASLCLTSRGQEQAQNLALSSNPEEIELDLDLVSEAKSLHSQGEPLPFDNIGNVGSALKRLEKEGALEGPTLIQMARTLQAGARLSRFLRDRRTTAPGLARLASGIAPLDGVSGPILESFEEGGVLSDHASPDLRQLRQRLADLHETLVKRMRGLMESPHINKYLQDHFYTQREDRYVLPIRTDAGSSVEGIVHGSSASGASIFIEPKEVVGLNNQLKVVEIEVRREESRILMELSELLAEECAAIKNNLDLLERLDVINARARLSLVMGTHRPRLSANGRLCLQAMRHPLMILSGTKVVANDLELEPGRALVITGPNAGGKTVCLKTLGLCALMLRAGMHLPVGPDSEIPIYETVLADMGDDQSIERNLSTFTAHLEHLQRFLDAARPGVLILLDEIAIGTDPGEGAALAQAMLEAMIQKGTQVVVTTHYERLKTMPHLDPRFVNASVGFDLEHMSPTYRLHLGIPGSSGALAVARRLGVSGELVNRAESLLDRGAQDLAALLTALAGERTLLEEQRAALAAATTEAQSLAAEQRTRIEELRLKERRAVQGEFAKAIEELKRARQELERIRTLLRRPPTKERLDQADRQISQFADIIRQYEPREKAEGLPAHPHDLVPGARILVPKLGGEGEIIEGPQRGKITVRVGGIRTQVAVEEIRLPDGASPAHSTKHSERSRPHPKGRVAASARAAQRTASIASAGVTEEKQNLNHHQWSLPGQFPGPIEQRPTPFRTDDITLDVRGFRVDEALAEVDKFIDRALRQGDAAFFIIHGHGTGALKSALRTHLSASDLVEHLQPAPQKDGGDGVTVVWLKE